MVADLSDDQLALHLDAAVHLAGAELYLDCYPEAEAHAERAMAVGLATGQSELVPLAYSILGQVKLLRGQLAEASDLLDNAVDGARLSGNVQALAGNLVNRSLTAVAAGDLDLALSTAQENVELTDGLDQSLVCAAGVALATALLETGDPGRAVDVLVRSSGGEELPLIPGVWRARSLELLTRCWLALGRQEEAARAASLAESLAARSDASRGALDGRPSPRGCRAGRRSSRDRRPARACLRRCRRRGRHARGRRVVAHPRRPRARASRSTRALLSPNCGRPLSTSMPAAPFDTEPPRSSSCDGSANASIGARSQATATDPVSVADIAANFRLPGSSWTAGRTRRSPKHSSSVPRRSRHTCATCSTSSMSPHASRSRGSSSDPKG